MTQRANPSPTPGPVAPEAPTMNDLVNTMGEDGLFGALEGDENPQQIPEPQSQEDDFVPGPENDLEDPEELEEEPEESEEVELDDDEPNDVAVGPELEADQFAAMLGLDSGALSVDDDGQVLFKAKVNGEESDVSLKDLTTSYQLRQALDQKSNALTDEHRAAMQAVAQQQVQLQSQLEQAELLTNGAMEQVMTEYQGMNWDQLRANDPAEYAAKRQEFGERYQRLQNQLAQIQANQGQMAEQQQQQQAQARMQVQQEEGVKLLQALPEWHDTTVRTREQTGMRDYLATEGFSPEEVGQILDHRQVVVVRKAMLYDQLQKNSKVAKKRVAKVPKVVKPGAAQAKSQGRRVKTNKAMQRLRKSGSERDAAAVFEGLLPEDL